MTFGRRARKASAPRGYNREVLGWAIPAVLAFAAGLTAQTSFFPLKDVRAGMHGTGRTVFTGSKVEEFQVEILGVLDDAGPKQSLILARLSGGPLDHAGVMEGMSGSPVYLDGKLAGAVAMAFPFAKDPIAAIRPIQDMLRPSAMAATRRAGRVALADADLTHIFAKPSPAMAGDARMVDIATPLGFGGFSRGTLEAFTPQLRQLGLEPRQMVSGGGETTAAMGNPADLQPGSMISVLLLAGDYSVGAQGTVTLIEGNRVFAFGHRFLDLGPTALPFARAEVVSVVASNNTSFKLATSKEWMGAIRLDGDTAISGDLGKLPAMVPVSIAVSRAGRAIDSYRMQMVGDPLLSPLLLQMAVYSAMDSTERAVGASSMRISGEIRFQNAPEPLRIRNRFAGDTLVALHRVKTALHHERQRNRRAQRDLLRRARVAGKQVLDAQRRRRVLKLDFTADAHAGSAHRALSRIDRGINRHLQQQRGKQRVAHHLHVIAVDGAACARNGNGNRNHGGEFT